MKLFPKNKRGDVTDIITIGFWLLVIAIGIMAVMFIIFKMVSGLQSSVISTSPIANTSLNTIKDYGSNAVPSTFLIIFFGLLLGIVVSSFFVKSHPIFIPVYILFAIMAIIVAVALGNVWGALKDVSIFSSILGTNSITGIMDTIMSHMVLVTLVTFILSIIIIFAKPGSAQVQQGSTPY